MIFALLVLYELQCTAHLNAIRLHIFLQSQFIQLLCVGNTIVSHDGVGEGQDLPSITGVCQSFGIAGEMIEKNIKMLKVSIKLNLQ